MVVGFTETEESFCDFASSLEDELSLVGEYLMVHENVSGFDALRMRDCNQPWLYLRR